MKVKLMNEKDKGELVRVEDGSKLTVFYDLTAFEHLIVKMLIELTSSIAALTKKKK